MTYINNRVCIKCQKSSIESIQLAGRRTGQFNGEVISKALIKGLGK